jgi:uncharacterized delta-60 repeat protein
MKARRAFAAICLALLSLPALAIRALANAGDLDPTFSHHGFTVTDLGGRDRAFAVSVRGARIVVAGTTMHGQVAVGVYRSDGSLDRSFAGGGTKVLGFGPTPALVAGAAIQPNGKILVLADVPFTGNSQAAVLRFRTDGVLDGTFGKAGLASVPSFQGRGLAVAPGGRVVVAGGAGTTPGVGGFSVFRLTSRGHLDPTFGADGIVTTDLRGHGQVAGDVLVRPDGTIVVAGYTTIGQCSGGGCETPFALARYLADGTLDPTFGGDGKVVSRVDMGCTCWLWAALGPGGDVVVSANEWLARFRSDGRLDHTFGDHGAVLVRFSGAVSSSVGAVTVDRKRRVLAVVGGGESLRGRVARYSARGVLDAGFGVHGRAPLPPTPHPADMVAVALQPNGRIVAAGSDDGGGDVGRRSLLVLKQPLPRRARRGVRPRLCGSASAWPSSRFGRASPAACPPSARRA